MEDDRDPLGAAKDRLLWVARRASEHIPPTLAHSESKGWENVRHKIQK